MKIATINNKLLKLPQDVFMTLPNALFSGTPSGWYKADHVVKDANNKVERWNDISSNGAHLYQTDQNKKPLYIDNGLNGHPVVNFVGANMQYLDGGDIHKVEDKSLVLITVSRITSGSSGGFCSKWSTSGSRYGMLKEGSNFSFYAYNSNLNPYIIPHPASFDDYRIHTCTISRPSNQTRYHINGNFIGSKTIANVPFGVVGSFWVGGVSGMFFYLTGDVAEVLVYIGNYTDENIIKLSASVTNYLKLKYNIL